MTREDFAGIADKFKLDIAAFANKVPERADDVVRAVMINLGRSLILMSPVGNPDLWKSPAPKGYVGGAFRNNWQFGVGSEPSGDGDSAALEATIAGAKGLIGTTCYLTNASPYGMALEFGHSTQAPAGMVRVTAERFSEFVGSAASEQT